MAISFNTNVTSLSVQRRITQTSDELSQSLQRLSSGLRINDAGDDPAGLSVADKLRMDAQVATVALQNANDGVSVAAITDVSLDEISSLLTRMAELAEQSANGINTQEQRSALSAEFIALGSEVERVSVSTEFNDINLLSSSSNITIQVGLDSTENSRLSLSGIESTLQSLGLANTGSSVLTVSILDTTSAASQLAAQTALAAVESALDTVSARRGIVGAQESRLRNAISYLQGIRENYVAAESRIRDLDVAYEVANQVRLQVLQNAGIAVLAQANQAPATALALLSGQ